MSNRQYVGAALLAACVSAAAILTVQAEKLPAKSMSTKGLLVSFDYDDGTETNRGYGRVSRANQTAVFTNGVAFYDGIYGRGPRGDEDIVIPQLSFDHFTIACSFEPTHTNGWGQYFFRIGMDCYSVLEVSLGKGDISVYGGKFPRMTAPYVKDEWNWLVLSVDTVRKQALLTVNGGQPVVRALPDDFYWFIPADRVDSDKFRRVTFGNWQCGKRYWGNVDDFMFYDRALDRKEVVGICDGKSVEQTAATPSVAGQDHLKIPVLRSDRWLFVPRHGEQSVYWNGSIATRNLALKARREPDGICVESVGEALTSELDLTLPVADCDGKDLAIVGIGSECDPYCIEVRKSSLARVKLPKSLKTVRMNAFAGCRRLTSVELPEGLLSIGRFAFSRCDGLENVSIPESVGRVEDGAFQKCSRLCKVQILGKRVWIGSNAFGGVAIGSEIPTKGWTSAPIIREDKLSGENASVPEGWVKGPDRRWFVRWDDAEAVARKTGKKIFALKTGSDWCGWCIRLHDNVLSKKDFLDYADKNLVLLYLDSPKTEGQPEAQKKHNEEVAKRLKMGGGYPNASVVDASGRSLGTIGGGGLTLEKYIEKLDGILKDARNAPDADAQKRAQLEELQELSKQLKAKRSIVPRTDKQAILGSNQVHSRTLHRAKASEVKKALDELTAADGCVKGLFRVTANDRVNKLIIVTDKANLDFVDAVISQLDVAAGSEK